MKLLYSLFIFLSFWCCAAQIPQERLTVWRYAGNFSKIYNQKTIIYLDSFGGKRDGISTNDSALEKAIAFLKIKNGGTIIFAEGNYLFLNSIKLFDSITLKGAGNSTVLNFDLKGAAKNCINISGVISDKKHFFESAGRGTETLNMTTGNLPDPSSIIQLFHNDSSLAFSNWAYGSIGQLARVSQTTVADNKMILQTPLRLNFKKASSTYFKEVIPVQNASIECMKIVRLDSTAAQTNNISFSYAYNCRVKGVESENCNFGHIVFDNSLHNEVIQSYLHHAFAYGGNGQGYGVVMQSASSDNKIENNIFTHLRHSVLLQSGANGNVTAYNYSRDPFWSDNPLSNAAGDLVCHGNFAHHNLFEGNICQNIVVDNSHGKNGPYNTYFRNRAELYGIIVSSGQDSQNFVANEVINTGPLMGQYIVSGNGHLTAKNNIKGTYQSNTNITILDTSLYLRSKPAFLNIIKNWPVIGFPINYNLDQNSAFYRYKDSLEMMFCYTPEKGPASDLERVSFSKQILVFPNPFSDLLKIKSGVNNLVDIYNSIGEKMTLEWDDEKGGILTEQWPCGMYLVLIDGRFDRKLIKL